MATDLTAGGVVGEPRTTLASPAAPCLSFPTYEMWLPVSQEQEGSHCSPSTDTGAAQRGPGLPPSAVLGPQNFTLSRSSWVTASSARQMGPVLAVSSGMVSPERKRR